ncbi:MAG: galactokinase family protein [Candidatus Saccharicenans sp.]|nr:galactokinase family protein [Candidatus Saccharicenans sp.]
MPEINLRVSSPGRICLFGEHQDYLDLEVIAAAISLRFYVEGRVRSDHRFIIHLPDTGEEDSFIPETELNYLKARDYLRSAVNVLLRLGCRLPTGWEITMHGEIPINAGTSSSSAMVVAWIKFLLEASGARDLAPEPEGVAELAHRAEVVEFREPGGKMDHYTSALGGTVWIKFAGGLQVTRLPSPPGTFVLGDSLEKKDTTGTLGSVRERVTRGWQLLKKTNPGLDLATISETELLKLSRTFPPEIRQPLHGAILNRDLTREGLKLFQAGKFDPQQFGRLLTEHQKVLRELVGISTPKIDRMLQAALANGALGGKINGSGGGGCMFVYAPDSPERVARAIEKSGGKPYIVRLESGLRVET